ncbi:MAG TPA: Hpt domain-containing protein [Nitrosomonas sp.]|nr:Hpt domain-containing protein [Nitrosomonas sp.]
MNTQKKLNISSIAGMKEGIHEISSLIEQNLDAYSQNLNDDKQIDSCRIYIHQLNGLFVMLELNNITVITDKIEQLIATADKQNDFGQAGIDVIKRTMNALLNYLDELVNGAEENPLRLFPVYRDLMQLLGHQQVSEVDLFYPGLTANPPLKPELADTDASQLKALAKSARAAYQTGLVQWLKNTASNDNLKRMHAAINQVAQFPGPPEQRVFWWVATGFLEGLLSQESNIELSSRRLCGKIEQALRHFAEGSLQDISQLTRELLYQIMQHYPSSTSEQIAAIRNAYALAPMTEASSSDLTYTESQQFSLQAMHETLKQANENWQAFCSGEHAGFASFVDSMAQLREQSMHIPCMPLQQLIESINYAAGSLQALHAHPSEINEGATMEIATALLHLESITENFNRLPDDLSKQVETISTRLSKITEADGILDEPQTATSLDEIKNPALKNKSQIQTVQEILINLRQIEETLEQFFQTPAERTALSELTPLFKQTSGVLNILDLHRADHLLNLCHNLLKKFFDPDYGLLQSEQNLLVDGISSLSFFLEAFKNDQSTSYRVIESAIAVFENAARQTTQPASPIIDSSDIESGFEETDTNETETFTDVYAEPKIKIDSGVDSELLSIFLEEADEILAEIAECIQNSQSNNSDLKSLTNIRRGFHTLKGSGRMVKLEFLSEAAWLMEKTLNHWLNEKKQTSGELIDFMVYAHQAFAGWCSSLKASGKAEIQLDQLLDRINHLTEYDEKEQSILPESIPTDQQDDIAPPTAAINIGSISIPADLFEIFVTESKQHLATLNQELKTLLTTHPAKISQPLTLSTHTLASTSRALELNFIADLSSKLEEWLSQLKEANTQLTESDTQLIQNCILQLDELLCKVHQQEFPDETDLQLVQLLSHEITKRQKQNRKLIETIHLSEPINLSEYRVKKTPPFIQQNETSSENAQEEIPSDALGNISTELRQVFLEEAKDTIPQISAKLRAWRILPQNDEIHISMLRLLHTLKGSAHMIGAQQLGELIHTMESEVEQAFNSPVVPISSIEKIEYEFDQLCERIEQLQTEEVNAETADTVNIVDISDTTDTAIADSPIATSPGSPELTDSSSPALPALSEVKPEETLHSSNVLRVNAELIDRLVNESGEASIIRTKIETQLNSFKQSLQDLTESIDRLHGQLREIEIQADTQMQSHIVQQQTSEQYFDPLELDRFTRFQELTRLMAESIDDVMTVQKNLSSTHSAATEAVAQQATINHQLQQELIRIRTVPFGNISERYYRVIRKTANDLGKKVNLTIQGEEIEIDRSVLEKMSASLEHILRNAIAHGIEKSDQRIQSGKQETGQIKIDLHQEGNEIIITVSDDGSGLDLESIHKEAIKLNLINENENLDDDQIAALIFSPGLTTHNQVTDTAGRGIGMDIVQNDISGLGGHITVSSEKNNGTVFHIQLPLTLAVAQSFLVSAGKQIFAIPTPIVAHVQELNPDALQSAYQDQQIHFDDETYPFTYLSFFLGQLEQRPETKRHNHILLLHSGNLRLAVHVDELVGNREVIVKNTGPQIMHAPGVEGATVTGEGKPVLILNPLKLLQRADVQQMLKTPVSEIITTSPEKHEPKATILVVDDSLTVRKVTSRLLEQEGYEVFTAKQGQEAVEIISLIKPDIILSDLEMPKMNGFELIQNIRNNPDTAQIPIIIITSRTADKHRQMATQLGANEFLGKPYKEDDLLGHISRYVSKQQA